MLTDEQIIQLSKRMEIPLAGVYFKDEIPKTIEFNKSYIINLQDSTDDDGNDNSGTHWTFFQCNKYANSGKIDCIFFDPYGAPPSENIKTILKKNCNISYIPHTNKDIQSLMNNACGFYCLALAHFINSSLHRSKDLYTDVNQFMDLFDDLNTSIDWKKNEYILKMFFQAKDPKLRKEIDVIKPTSSILGEDTKGGFDGYKQAVDIKMV